MRNERIDKIICCILSVVIVIVYVALIVSGDAVHRLGDFPAFYTGAMILKNRLGEKLYDIDTQKYIQSQSVPPPLSHNVYLPYVHPPYEALIFIPLTYLSPMQAYWAWIFLNVVILMFTVHLVSAHLPSKLRPIIWLIATSFFPIYVALFNGQDSIVTLMLFMLAFSKWKHGREHQAGGFLALALYKFQLLLPLVLIFLFKKRIKMLGAFFVVAIFLAGISLAMVGLEAIASYVRLIAMYANESSVGSYGIKAAVMLNLRGFFLRVLGDNSRLVNLAVLMTSLSLLGLLLLGWKGNKIPHSFDLRFSLLIVITLLVSYHMHAQDYTLLILPVALILNYFYGRSPARLETDGARKAPWLLKAITFLLATPIPYLISAANWGMNFIVLLLLMLTVLLYREINYLNWNHA